MPEFLGGPNIRKIVRRGTDKAPFGRVSVQTSGQVAVVRVHSVKPERVTSRRSADLVPELELIVGPHPPVPELPPRDAQKRFQLVFRRFLGAFARPMVRSCAPSAPSAAIYRALPSLK